MQLHAHAKINWSLDIVGQRADGYHLLDGIMQPLALHDTLEIVPSDSISLQINGSALPADENNLVLRAARLLQEEFSPHTGASMTLEKRIPMGAGLGGGSADAAAALIGLNRMWQLGLSEAELCTLGVRLGADVPFCVCSRPLRAQGIGEKLSSVSCGACFPLVLVQPCTALSTKEIFSAYHAAADIAHPDFSAVQAAFASGAPALLDAACKNVLETVSIPRLPEIALAKQRLTACGAGFARMTGSGSVVFGAFDTDTKAENAWKTLQKEFPVCILTRSILHSDPIND